MLLAFQDAGAYVVSLSSGTSPQGPDRAVHDYEEGSRLGVACKVSGLEPKNVCELKMSRNLVHETVVIKSSPGHPKVANERDILMRFQHRTPHLRPLIDEIEDPSNSVTIALKYSDSDLLTASIEKKLNRGELKYVTRCVLEALKVLHEYEYVHAGEILSNKLLIIISLIVREMSKRTTCSSISRMATIGFLKSSSETLAGHIIRLLSLPLPEQK